MAVIDDHEKIQVDWERSKKRAPLEEAHVVTAKIEWLMKRPCHVQLRILKSLGGVVGDSTSWCWKRICSHNLHSCTLGWIKLHHMYLSQRPMAYFNFKQYVHVFYCWWSLALNIGQLACNFLKLIVLWSCPSICICDFQQLTSDCSFNLLTHYAADGPLSLKSESMAIGSVILLALAMLRTLGQGTEPLERESVYSDRGT